MSSEPTGWERAKADLSKHKSLPISVSTRCHSNYVMTCYKAQGSFHIKRLIGAVGGDQAGQELKVDVAREGKDPSEAKSCILPTRSLLLALPRMTAS